MKFTRRLFALGFACLVLAVIVTLLWLPRAFPFLPASAFATDVISMQAERPGVKVIVSPQPKGRAMMIEWKASQP